MRGRLRIRRFWTEFDLVDQIYHFELFPAPLGLFSDGFWEVFSNFFAIFLEKANFLKYNIFLWKNHSFLYVELLKNNPKT